MPIIKDLKKARKKVLLISNRFDLSKRKKELQVVTKILSEVKKKGDKALIYYAKKFDKVSLTNIKVPASKIQNSTKYISKKLLSSIKRSIQRIEKFQRTNIPVSWIKRFSLGEKMGYRYVPLESVGIYIPGGKNPLVSTVLMTVVPGKVAGVKRIAIFTPPPVSNAVLSACKLLGIKEVYQVGGAQAVAAASYGTESIKAVDKIIGPGNIYVTLAKKNVFGTIGIDGLYGPSEIAIIADKSAKAEFLAIDLLSQLEHGSGLESAFMVTNSEAVAKKTEKMILQFAKSLPNKKIVLSSWKKNGAIVLLKKLEKGVELVNLLAPEHLEIITKNPASFLSKIKNAGAIFLGEYSCESVGDYMAGPSHCLPTGGNARFSGGLTVMDFMKKISVISFDKSSFKKVSGDIVELALQENLKAHADAVKIRL